MKYKAVYAGSFDPVTKGHLNIIERAAGMYEELTVAIAVNPQKQGFFSINERADLMREATSHLANVRVDSFTGLAADYVNEHSFTAYIRGLRSNSDFESEFQMAQMNARLFTEGTETVFLITDPEYSFISSSLIKEVAVLGGSVDGMVPGCVASAIKNKVNK